MVILQYVVPVVDQLLSPAARTEFHKGGVPSILLGRGFEEDVAADISCGDG